MNRSLKALLVATVFVPLSAFAQYLPLERVVANDNRQPSGILRGGTLEVTLEIRNGNWYPASDSGANTEIQAFAEAGKQLVNPGPLIRVPEGTELHITLRNTLDKAARVYGFVTRPDNDDEGTVVAANSEKTFRFKTGVAGNY